MEIFQLIQLLRFPKYLQLKCPFDTECESDSTTRCFISQLSLVHLI